MFDALLLHVALPYVYNSPLRALARIARLRHRPADIRGAAIRELPTPVVSAPRISVAAV
jgi:hypothetical protein